MWQVTDSDLAGDDGLLTPQHGVTATAPVAESHTVTPDPRLLGGGGIGWLQPTDGKRVSKLL